MKIFQLLSEHSLVSSVNYVLSIVAVTFGNVI